MKLRTQILLEVGAPIFVGLMILLITTISLQLTEHSSWTDDTSESSERTTLDNVAQLTSERALLMSEVLEQAERDTLRIVRFVEGIANADIGHRVIDSYWGERALDNEPPHTQFLDGRVQSLEASYLYHPDVLTPAQLAGISAAIQTDIDSTATADELWRLMYEANPIYLALYVGTENGLLRLYPWEYSDGYSTMVYEAYCDGPAQRVGYDPRCRQWYGLGRVATAPGDVAFTDPYRDAGSGKLTISSSRALLTPGGAVWGVGALDVGIDVVRENIMEGAVFDGGYAFIMTTEGDIVLHPRHDTSSGEVVSVRALEFADDDAAWTSVLDQLGELGTTIDVGAVEYTRDGEQWHAAFATAGDSRFVVATAVPHADVIAASKDAESEIETVLNTQIGIFCALLAIVFAVLVWIVFRVADAIVGPMTRMTRAAARVEAGDYKVELAELRNTGTNRDVREIYQTFSDLLTTLRMGNAAYEAGELDAAMSTYRAARALFERMKAEHGIGIVLNNMSSVHRSLGNYGQAVEALVKSLEIAERNLQDMIDNGGDADRRLVEMQRVAGRLANLANLYAEMPPDTEEHEEAEATFARAIEMYRETSQVEKEGKVVYGLVTFLIGEERIDDACNVISKMLSERIPHLRESSDHEADILGAYARVMEAEVATAEERVEDACVLLIDALEGVQEIDRYFLSTAVGMLRKLWESRDGSAGKARGQQLLRATPGIMRIAPKNVIFVLDHSASMNVGGRLQSARRNVCSLVSNVLNPGDAMSLVLFSTHVHVHMDMRTLGADMDPVLTAVRGIPAGAGCTSLWGGVNHALDMVDAGDSTRPSYIVVLTDGEDNRTQQLFHQVTRRVSEGSATVFCIALFLDSQTALGKLKTLADSSERGRTFEVTESSGLAALDNAFATIGQEIHDTEQEVMNVMG